MTNVMTSTPIDKPRFQALSFNGTVWLAGAALLVVLAIAIYLDATSAADLADDLDLLVVFP